MSERALTRVFWSGGSQAVRLPKAMRLEATEVTVRRDGHALVIEPVESPDSWGDFWEQLRPLRRPIRRGRDRAAERRQAL